MADPTNKSEILFFLFFFGFTVMLTDKPVEELNATIFFPLQSANIEPHPSFLTVAVTVYALPCEKMIEMSPSIQKLAFAFHE